MRVLVFVILIGWLKALPAASQPFIDPDRIPYTDETLWGYANRHGTVVIQPQWPNAGFFQGGKARVLVPGSSKLYALIDHDGKYLIPPELNWYGHWSGWERTGFNISDSAGRYGVVDSNGVVRIARRFQPFQSNFRFSKVWNRYVIAAKLGGCVGLIDTAGEVLIPFEYDWIGEAAQDDERNAKASGRLFIPEMSDYMVVWKDRKKAVINSRNQIVFQFGDYQRLNLQHPRWIQAQDIDGKCSFFDHTARLVIRPRYTEAEVFEERYFVVSETARQLPGAPVDQFYRGLLDTNDSIVLPIRYSGVYTDGTLVTVTSDDTQFVRTGRSRKAQLPVRRLQDLLSDDRPSQFIRELDYATLEPLGEWKLQDRPERRYQMACGFSEYRRFSTPGYHIPFQLGHSVDFTRDGIRWTPVHAAGPGQHLVYGIDSSGRHRTAIVDNRGDPIFGPIDGRWDLWYYNQSDGLFIEARSTTRDRMRESEYAVLDEWFRPLTDYRKRRPAAALQWNGNVYFLAARQEEPEHPWSGNEARYTLTDTVGNMVTALARYGILGFFDSAAGIAEHRDFWSRARVQPGFGGSFLVSDSAGRRGVVDINGQIRLAAISFRHTALEIVGGGTYLVGTANDRRWLRADGREVLPGLGRVDRIESVETMLYNGFGLGKPGMQVPGLLMVTISGSDGKPFWFYALPEGIAFSSGFGDGHAGDGEPSKN